MRAFAELTYGVPPEQVIGSSGRLKFEVRGGVPTLVKLREIDVEMLRKREEGEVGVGLVLTHRLQGYSVTERDVSRGCRSEFR